MNFDFFAINQVLVGVGRFEQAGALAGQLGRRPFVVYNVPPPERGGIMADLLRMLERANLPPAHFEQRGEPKTDDVDAALAAARAHNADCVIGIGGGSAIDTAKAVAGLLTNGGVALDYMEVVGKGQKITRPAAPWMAIPTTAGTGAEATRNAVVGYPAKSFKASIRSELLMARTVLVDGQLGVDVPPEVTAGCGMDALCQLIESYTSTGANPITDALALAGIRLASEAITSAYADGRNVAARQDMAIAAMLSGMTLTSAGLGAVHGFAAPMGAKFPVPHGVVCAALLAPVVNANIEAVRDDPAHKATLARYATLGRILVGTPEALEDDEWTPNWQAEAADLCAGALAELVQDLRIPPLSRYGLGEEHIPEMIALARKASSMRYNPVTLSDEAMEDILRRGIAGKP